MRRKWRVRDEDPFIPLNIDLEAIMSKELRIKTGASEGTVISPRGRDQHVFFMHCDGSWSTTSAAAPTRELANAATGSSGLSMARNKLAQQMRKIGPAMPPTIEDPVEEGGFVYPKDKVVNIHKGRRLRRRG